jgi:hypothetical protein
VSERGKIEIANPHAGTVGILILLSELIVLVSIL